MRELKPIRSRLLLLILLLGGILGLLLPSSNYGEDWWPFGKKTEKSEIPISIDPDPLPADLKKLTSIAPMVKETSRSVVNVFSTKLVRETQQLQTMPFFNDPFFRHFFGDQFRFSPQWQPKTRREQSLGSGVIVSGDGYIITNNHVIDGADEIKVLMADNEKEYKAELIGKDPKTDIAILKVKAKNLPAITLGDSDILEVGDFVVAIGNPFGVGQTVTSGIVSAVGRGNIGITDYEDFIQTDASINPGNSGGALVDAAGRLIGINTAILSRSGGNQGIGFAVPINLAKSVMDRILNHGRVIRGFLGVTIQDVTPDLAEAFDLSSEKGAVVGDVNQDSAAAEAGIQKGDVIVEFNGKKVEDSRNLRLMVAKTAPDTDVAITVIRNSKEIKLKATLKELPGSEIAQGMKKSDAGSNLLSGITVDDLNPRIRQQLNVPSDVSGAVVVKIDPESLGAKAGVQKGDIILEINRKPVKNANDAIKLSRGIKGDSVLLYVWSKGSGRYIVVKTKN